MKRSSPLVLTFFVSLLCTALAASGCRQEPVIVIHFEPQDLAVPSPAQGLAPAPAVAPPTVSKRDAGARAEAPATQTGDLATEAMRLCARETDCIVVAADCCGCTGGGKATAIARRHEKDWRVRHAARCADVMCAQAMSSDESCGKAAACRERRCVLGGAKAAATGAPKRGDQPAATW